MRGKPKYSMLMLILLAWAGMGVQAQVVVSSVQSWTRSVDASDLTTPYEAGADLNPTVETPSNFNQIDIRNVANSKQWKVTVSRQDMNWPAAFTISVKRTSSGIPCAGCLGVNVGASPTVYVPVGTLETDLLFGTGEVIGIDLQFKVDGLSLVVDADSYSTEITYTLYGD